MEIRFKDIITSQLWKRHLHLVEQNTTRLLNYDRVLECAAACGENRPVNVKWLLLTPTLTHLCSHCGVRLNQHFINTKNTTTASAELLFVVEWCLSTQWWEHRAADGQDILMNQFDGTGPVGDLVVEVVGQSCSFQLQLLSLQRRFCWRFYRGNNIEIKLELQWKA